MNWYHGSNRLFEELKEGSTITPLRHLAVIFSHRPAWVTWFETPDGERIKHNGRLDNGYLYEILVEDEASDIVPHPTSAMAPGVEWLLRRPLPVRLIGRTRIDPDSLLTEEEEADCRWRMNER